VPQANACRSGYPECKGTDTRRKGWRCDDCNDALEMAQSIAEEAR
jgi:transposase-like protein